MEVLHQCCAGLDVHKATVVACLGVQEGGGYGMRSVGGGPTRRNFWRSATGCGKRAARTSRWRRPAFTGSRCGTSWKASSSFSSPTPRISVTCQGAKATLTMRPGSPICWRMG